MLNYAYAVLAGRIERAICVRGLDPAVGVGFAAPVPNDRRRRQARDTNELAQRSEEREGCRDHRGHLGVLSVCWLSTR
mgnify:CR=1 FL=1